MTKTKFSLVLLVCVLLMSLAAHINLSKQINPGFHHISESVDGQTIWRITHSDYPNLAIGTEINQIQVGGQVYDIQPYWLKQTLIDVKTDAEFDQFKTSERFLYEAKNQSVSLIDRQQNHYPIQFSQRHLQNTSVYFWSYYLLGFASIVMALLTLKASHFSKWHGCNLLAAFAFALSSVVAVSSKDRLWAMHPDFIEQSFYLGNLGLRIFSVCYFTILWNIPHRLAKGRFLQHLPVYFAMLYIVTWLLQVTSIYKNFGLLMIQVMFIIGAFGFISLFFQWYISKKTSKNQLVNLIAMRWLFVTNLTCALFGFGYNLLWERGYVHSEHADLFNLMSAFMLAIGIVVLLLKEHLYRFESWWQAWGVVAGLASSLFSAVWLSEVVFGYTYVSVALAILIFFVTYFSIGFLFRYRYAEHGVTLLEMTSPKLIEIANTADSEEAKHMFHELMIEAFKPLGMRYVSLQNEIDDESLLDIAKQLKGIRDGNTSILIVREGQALLIRSIFDNTVILLEGAAQGKRLFSGMDAQRLQVFWNIAFQGRQIKDAYIKGELSERKRIADDLYDEIGSKLQELSAPNNEFGRYARETLQDLNTLTSELSSEVRTLYELVDNLDGHILRLCDNKEIIYKSYISIDSAIKNKRIATHAATMLSSIINELSRNAIQHSCVTKISLSLNITPVELRLRFDNDGETTDPKQWKSGLGTLSIQRRVHDVSGSISWQSLPDGGVSCLVSWQLSNWV